MTHLSLRLCERQAIKRPLFGNFARRLIAAAIACRVPMLDVVGLSAKSLSETIRFGSNRIVSD
jgi:hypothetical protein